MLEKFIPKLIEDLDLGKVTLSTGVPGNYALPLDEGLIINLTEIPNGIQLKCAVAPYPKEQEEAFSTQAMLANLFGQGTNNAVLGLTLDANTLTLTQNIDYHIEYKDFRDLLEDFINTVDFWHDEALNYK